MADVPPEKQDANEANDPKKTGTRFDTCFYCKQPVGKTSPLLIVKD